MDLVHAHDLKRLAADRGTVRVSLFLPTHRSGPEVLENRIRLKNLLRQVESTLTGDERGIEAAVESVRRLVDERWRWRQPSDGLALFISPDEVQFHRVPIQFAELATIGRRFVVGPLLPMLAAGRHFFVLELESDGVRLFEGTRFRFDEVALNGSPLAELTMPRRRRKQVHAFVADRGGAGASALFHGVGDDAEDHQRQMLQHFRHVDRGLREVLVGERAPLVVAAVRRSQALYRKVSTYPHLLAQGIDGNPRDTDIDLMHRLSWAIVEPELRSHEGSAASTYRALLGTGRTTSRPSEVLTAADQGRIDTLFVSTDASWRQGGSEDASLIFLEHAPCLAEQLDLAAVATLQSGGAVFAVPPHRMPDATPVAATLRY